MAELPKHIIDSITSGNTSLGDNPAFPPSEKFIEKLVGKYYNSVSEKIEGESKEEIVRMLNKLVSECQKKERPVRSALEKLCGEIVNDMFEIPEDTVKIDISLTDTVDTSQCRAIPEEDGNYSFDNIEDMKFLGSEIKKRRMLNALVEGASEYIGYNISSYVKELFDIEPSLPEMYMKIIAYSRYLMYELDENELEMGNSGGDVKVFMKPAPDILEIKAEATLFPVLLQNTIKGILEVAILQGLPDNKEKAFYVMKKSDYKMAEAWDSRIGVPMWEKVAESLGDENEVPLNYFLMELSMMPSDTFNNVMQELLAGTKNGKEMVDIICSKIKHDLDEEDFNDYISKTNDLYPIEDGYFTEEDFPSEEPYWY